MTDLAQLSNTSRGRSHRRRVGRGPASGVGKTCGRGIKGAGARSGYRRRLTYEGGQMRLFRKLPTRGFSRARFQKPHATINLQEVNRYFSEGDTVNHATLHKKGLIPNQEIPVKLLGMGEITKKLASVELTTLSASAKEKLDAAKIPFSAVGVKGAAGR